jgi:heparosan-N-sulfate-glucuronate 5-epimerase
LVGGETPAGDPRYTNAEAGVITAVRSSVSATSPPSDPGFFSSAGRLTLPLGPAIDPQAVRGYPIDMRVKARVAAWPGAIDSPAAHHVVVAQYGLGAFERYLAGEGEVWLAAALGTGGFLADTQRPDGSWLNDRPLVHTLPLRAPWKSGMAQGEAASLLVRLYLETGEDRFAEAASRALAPLWRPSEAGGVCAMLDGFPWPEEYPTDPPSFVLNGAIFAWWGVRDVAVALADAEASTAFERAVDGLAANLHRFDTGWWSLYCLRRYPVPPVASSFYQALHITQLEAMQLLAPRPALETVRARWERYFESAALRRRAFAAKALFRLVVPRNRVLGPRLPWAHF